MNKNYDDQYIIIIINLFIDHQIHLLMCAFCINNDAPRLLFVFVCVFLFISIFELEQFKEFGTCYYLVFFLLRLFFIIFRFLFHHHHHLHIFQFILLFIHFDLCVFVRLYNRIIGNSKRQKKNTQTQKNKIFKKREFITIRVSLMFFFFLLSSSSRLVFNFWFLQLFGLFLEFQHKTYKMLLLLRVMMILLLLLQGIYLNLSGG